MPEPLVLAQDVTTQPELTTDILVVLGVVALALVLFLTERLPIDVTAILLIVVLVVLEPWTGVDPSTGVSGFSNDATITVLAMLILSGGVARTGLVQELGWRMAAYAGDSIHKQLFATSPASGFLSPQIGGDERAQIRMVPQLCLYPPERVRWLFYDDTRIIR